MRQILAPSHPNCEISPGGHTVDVDRLPLAPVVLDVGCRGFDFTEAVLKLRPDAAVFALDPDPSIHGPHLPGCTYLRFALVHDDRASSLYAMDGAGLGNFLVEGPGKIRRPDCGWEFDGCQVDRVACVNIVELMKRTGVTRWDLVKLDCEGSEFGILENWPGPIADQITVEFHDWTGPRGDLVKAGYYEKTLWPKLPWYEVVQHEWLPLGADATRQIGHWDSLLTLKV